MHNQSSKQKLFRVSKSKNHHRKASKQASKQERSKNIQNTSEGNPPPTPSLTNPNTRKEPIHPSTYTKNTFRKKDPKSALPLPTKPHPPPPRPRPQTPLHPLTLQNRGRKNMSYARRNRELRTQSRNNFARGASLRRQPCHR
jgi:hypothetical protein